MTLGAKGAEEGLEDEMGSRSRGLGGCPGVRCLRVDFEAVS